MKPADNLAVPVPGKLYKHRPLRDLSPDYGTYAFYPTESDGIVKTVEGECILVLSVKRPCRMGTEVRTEVYALRYDGTVNYSVFYRTDKNQAGWSTWWEEVT